ncbi:hypothetical protein VHUM_03035 [Vanrija humicola]|uniref:Major facilitator superfamily (MFS) profile domain-containing protein n=1 Tax=Vanrija humicola TaxID=5417 RepID=A0A7D8ZMB2_VANHU|nr:hypothetical protein VHUM_03035 [Vanrija humicola]
MASSKDPVDTKTPAEAEVELSVLNRAPTRSTTTLAEPASAPQTELTPTSTDPLEASRAIDASAPDGGWHAWAMVGCCAMLGFWFVGVTYSWGVLQTTLVERHLAPASTLAFVGSIAVSMLSFMAILNSRILMSLGARKMAVIGTVLMSFSQIFASFTTRNIGGLFVTAGVMMGFGVGFCFMVISITPAQYFTTKRGTAVGLVYAAGGLGGAVISLGLEAGVRNLGLEWTFRLVGLVMLVTCLPAAWYVKERTTVVRKEFVDWSLFRNLDFIVLFVSGALATFPLFVPPFFLPLYAQSMHLSGTTGAALVCVFNFSSAIGRIATGFLSDRLLGPLNTLFAVLFITCLSLLVLWPSSVSLAPLIIFVLVNGASSGGFFAIMPTVVNNIMGSQRMTVAFGMIVTGWGGGYLMGAPIAGYLLAAYGGQDRGIVAYRPAVFWAGGMAAGAAFLVAFLRWRKSPHLMIKM